MLSGDSLFVSSAGRPDLLGDDQTDTLVEQQFHTLRDFYLTLPDSVIVYPAHGHGSPCGADIGARLSTTIGYEKRFNEYLKLPDLEAFKEHALGSAPPVPVYYPLMKKINAAGPEVLGSLPAIKPLSPKDFRKAVEDKTGVLVDTRHLLAFGGGHIAGSINIGAQPMLSLWAGWLLDPDKPILLVVEEAKLEEVLRLFVRTGYTRFAGYLAGGITAWENAGFPLSHIGQMTVHELKKRGTSAVQVVDVRSPGEWASGHIPDAHYHFLPKLEEELSKLDKSKPTAVYCASGYRASMGASILENAGFKDVYNIPGSFGAWKKMDYPILKEEKVPEVSVK